MKVDKDTSFHWSNYLKPTPANLQYLAIGLKGLVLTAAGSSAISGNPELGLYIMMGGAALDELAKFFGKVAQDYEREIKITTTETTTITDIVKEVLHEDKP